MSHPELAGRAAFITGAGRGIGAAYARALSRQGVAIAIGEIDMTAAEEVAHEITLSGGTVLPLLCDVAQESSVSTAIADAASRLGRLDILINNAALHLKTYNQPCTVLPDAEWRRMMDVNVTGIVTCTRSARPHLAKSGAGVVINQSSIASEQLDTAYAISKLAVRGLTVALARELAPDAIRVCGIAPGLIATDQLKAEMPASLIEDFRDTRQLVRKVAGPEDLCGTLLFLCSDAAQFITGETIIVAGGYMPRA